MDKAQDNYASKITARIRELPKYVDMNIWVGGTFEYKKGKTEYVGGGMYMKQLCWVKDLSVRTIRSWVIQGYDLVMKRVPMNFSVWYRLHGRNLTNGRRKLEVDDDIVHMIDSRDLNDRLIIWALVEKVDPVQISELGQKVRSKNVSFRIPKTEPVANVDPPLTKAKLKPIKKECVPARKSLRLSPLKGEVGGSDEEAKVISESEFEKHIMQLKKSPMPHSQKSQNSLLSTPEKTSQVLPQNINASVVHSENPSTSSPASVPHVNAVTPPRIKTLAVKTKARKSVAHKPKQKRGKATAKGNGKACSNKVTDLSVDGEDWSGEGEWSSESDKSDLDGDFIVGEDDKVEDEIFTSAKAEQVTKKVDIREDGLDTDHVNEVDYDSDELNSLHGSDEEVDPHPTFNPEVDFKRKINLFQGLKFTSAEVVRKAIRFHSIENHYDFYFLHNGKAKVSVYCKKKCGCPWDKDRSKIVNCKCGSKNKCNFKIVVRKISMEDKRQIRQLNLKHTCGFFHESSKVTSQYLAEKYLEDWRADPTWKLKRFIERVYRDLGVHIKYYKAWFARSRVKIILYGDASEEYARVFEYGFAILKYNPGSSAVVVVEGIERPPPTFLRMYVCLQACKTGFKRGCRPLIGVDGCHLKGAFPGMILVAVSKDGNNNIYPVAWAVVEVENKDSWIWFLELLIKDVDHPNGAGLTLMSDRQKGLVEAMDVVVPEAEIRFCARHIWANFKLKFGGEPFKEHFWKSARATTKADFDFEMEKIKDLSEPAFEYLEAIPTKNWAKHAFLPNCKSDMVLNNICETFNSVLRDARDKPIVTCLEWIRRYVMKRNTEKWDGVQGHEGLFMPFVDKVFQFVSEKATNCYVIPSRLDIWEVDYYNDRYVVNLVEKTCSCYRWELTGLPCAHAWACIIKKRQRPEDFVHEYYSKQRYLEAYSPSINPMPGMKQWERRPDMVQPLPPVIKRMPGRPSHKKRKKEVGEAQECQSSQQGKKQKKCSNCGIPGHYKTKCINQAQPKNQGGRPPSNNIWNVTQRKKNMERAMRKGNVNTDSGACTSQLPSSQSSSQAAAHGPTQSSQPTPHQSTQASSKAKLPIQSKHKKAPVWKP